jgi:recombination protein RecR
MNPNFKSLVKLFTRLPGVGPRQAARFVLALLEKNQAELQEFGQAISDLKQSVQFCQECHNLADEYLCHICTDPKRTSNQLLVVEKVTDLSSLEQTGLYKGLYHVLGGTIDPVNGITPESLKIKSLQTRVDNVISSGKNVEIILATNPSTAGEMTALYLRDIFENRSEISVTRLARGLASGSNLEYADEITLKNALDHRK